LPVSVCKWQTLTGSYAAYFGLFRDLQRIIDLNTQIANCTYEEGARPSIFVMSQQSLIYLAPVSKGLSKSRL
jgi:hypothetical protein